MDIVARLRETAARGHTVHGRPSAADQLLEAADQIERLRAERGYLQDVERAFWIVLRAAGRRDVVVTRQDLESFPGNDAAKIEWSSDARSGDVTLRAIIQQKGEQK